jgi:hypothetical protein
MTPSYLSLMEKQMFRFINLIEAIKATGRQLFRIVAAKKRFNMIQRWRGK